MRLLHSCVNICSMSDPIILHDPLHSFEEADSSPSHRLVSFPLIPIHKTRHGLHLLSLCTSAAQHKVLSSLEIRVCENEDGHQSISDYLSILFIFTRLVAQPIAIAVAIFFIHSSSPPIRSPCSYTPSRCRYAKLSHERSRRTCSSQFPVSVFYSLLQ